MEVVEMPEQVTRAVRKRRRRRMQPSSRASSTPTLPSQRTVLTDESYREVKVTNRTETCLSSEEQERMVRANDELLRKAQQRFKALMTTDLAGTTNMFFFRESERQKALLLVDGDGATVCRVEEFTALKENCKGRRVKHEYLGYRKVG